MFRSLEYVNIPTNRTTFGMRRHDWKKGPIVHILFPRWTKSLHQKQSLQFGILMISVYLIQICSVERAVFNIDKSTLSKCVVHNAAKNKFDIN